MIDITEEATALHLDQRFAFLPKIGASLITYNRIEYPSAWMEKCQADLDRALHELHATTERINLRLGSKPNWFLDAVYKRTKKGILYARYYLLEDGLHPSRQTAERMIISIRKDIWTNHMVLYLSISCWSLVRNIVMDSSGLTIILSTHQILLLIYKLYFGWIAFMPNLMIFAYLVLCRHLVRIEESQHRFLWVGSSAPFRSVAAFKPERYLSESDAKHMYLVQPHILTTFMVILLQ